MNDLKNAIEPVQKLTDCALKNIKKIKALTQKEMECAGSYVLRLICPSAKDRFSSSIVKVCSAQKP